MGRMRYMYLVMSDIILLFATRSCSRSSRRDARLSRTSMSRVSSVETAPQVLVRILRRMSGIDFHVKLVVHQTLLIVWKCILCQQMLCMILNNLAPGSFPRGATYMQKGYNSGATLWTVYQLEAGTSFRPAI